MYRIRILYTAITAILQWLKKEMKEADSIFMYYTFASLYLTVLLTLTVGVLYLIIELYHHVGISGILDFLNRLLSDLTDLTTTDDSAGDGQ